MLFLPDRALILKPRWLNLILSGEKIWELRGSRTNIRGTVALAASGTGLLLGAVDILDSVGPYTAEELAATELAHRVPAAELQSISYTRTYAWVLSAAKRFQEPVPYAHPVGAVVWVKLG